jgi:hypothetical protein
MSNLQKLIDEGGFMPTLNLEEVNGRLIYYDKNKEKLAKIVGVLASQLERMRNENSDPYGIAKHALQQAEKIADIAAGDELIKKYSTYDDKVIYLRSANPIELVIDATLTLDELRKILLDMEAINDR